MSDAQECHPGQEENSAQGPCCLGSYPLRYDTSFGGQGRNQATPPDSCCRSLATASLKPTDSSCRGVGHASRRSMRAALYDEPRESLRAAILLGDLPIIVDVESLERRPKHLGLEAELEKPIWISYGLKGSVDCNER